MTRGERRERKMDKYKLDFDKPHTESDAMLEVARALNNIANEMALKRQKK